jgi:hypothetical protein
MNRYCSVLWMPPGANRFCSRQARRKRLHTCHNFWPRWSCSGPDGRAHQDKAKIRARLIADLDPDEWELPPKPKRMRGRTYDRYNDLINTKAILDEGVEELWANYSRAISLQINSRLRAHKFPLLAACSILDCDECRKPAGILPRASSSLVAKLFQRRWQLRLTQSALSLR